MYKKRGYSNENYLKYPIKIKNRSSLRETSFSRRPIDFKKCLTATISIFLIGVWDHKSLFLIIEKTASSRSQSNCFKFGPHPHLISYLGLFVIAF